MLGVSQIAALHSQAAEHLPAPAFTPAVAGGLCLFERMHEVFACLLEFAFVLLFVTHVQILQVAGPTPPNADDDGNRSPSWAERATESRIGLFARFASASASVPHGHQSTGLCLCCSR